MRRLIGLPLLLVAWLCAAPASAQNNWTTPGGSNASGVVQMCLNGSNLAVSCTDPSALPRSVSATQGTNPWQVTGFDSGAVTGVGTGTSTSHTAGQSVGGLITVAVARANGGSGIITNFSLTDAGGSATALVVRIWQKNPASTTCTDGQAFASNATDDLQLIVPPFQITPAAPASTTGDSKFYASLAGLTWDYKNGSSNTNLYVCLNTVSTQTIAGQNETVMMSGPQN